MSAPPPPPPPPSCEDVLCTNNSLSGSNLLTSLYIDIVLGVLCYCGFVLWRGVFPVYHGREFLPGVRRRPPPLKLGGHWQLWSWLIPTWNVTDAEFLATAGFDALVCTRVLAYGVALFLPLVILGVGVLLPVNYFGGSIAAQEAGLDNSNATYVFARMTLSNIKQGSPVLWLHFTFMVLFVMWACYLLVVFYEEHIGMQHTLVAGQLDAGGEDLNCPALEESTSASARAGGRAVHPSRDDTAAEEGVVLNMEGGGAQHEGTSEGGASDESDLKAGEDAAEGNADGSAKGGSAAAAALPAGGEVIRLWPVRKGEAQCPQTRPRFPGQYAVIVRDEPVRKFLVRRGVNLGIRQLGKASSLVAAQGEVDRKINWYWQSGLTTAKGGTLSRRGKSVTRRGGAAPIAMVPEEGGEDGDIDGVDLEVELNVDVMRAEAKKSLPARLLPALARFPSWAWRAIKLSSEEKEEQAARETAARMRVVTVTYGKLFGDEFDGIVPIHPTKDVDKQLQPLYACQAALARVRHSLASLKEGAPEAKAAKLRAREQALMARESALAAAVVAAREASLAGPPCPTFFAVFHTAKAAAAAAALNPNPVHWRAFHVLPAPDPENVHFPSLQRDWWTRRRRALVSLCWLLLIMLFPIGLITGAFSQLEVFLCGASGVAVNNWFCSSNKVASTIRNLITGFLPSILTTVYQSVILPVYILSCAQAESTHVSLSAVDRRAAVLFFHWTWSNFFVGALLGGTITSVVRHASDLDNLNGIIQLLGDAIPSTSNYFINYVMLRALSMTAFRLFFPHNCVANEIAQWCRVPFMPKPATDMDYARAHPLRNSRYSRDIFIAAFAVYICSLSYAVISPIILPFALLYFVLLFMVWRYQQLYVYQAGYNSRGQMWCVTAHRVMACLAVMVMFTGIMFIVKKAYVQGALALTLVEAFIVTFDKFLTTRYDVIYEEVPVAVLESQPRVELDEDLFVPPPLRRGAQGWFCEWGKVWQGWGAFTYW